ARDALGGLFRFLPQVLEGGSDRVHRRVGPEADVERTVPDGGEVASVVGERNDLLLRLLRRLRRRLLGLLRARSPTPEERVDLKRRLRQTGPAQLGDRILQDAQLLRGGVPSGDDV